MFAQWANIKNPKSQNQITTKFHLSNLQNPNSHLCRPLVNEDEFDAMAVDMTVKSYADKVKCPTLLVTGEFDPLCPLEDAIEVYGDLTCQKEMWVVENQFHPLWGIPNLGGLDCHHYICDWLQRVLVDGKANDDRIAYVAENGEGPFSDCEWTPPVGPGQAYF